MWWWCTLNIHLCFVVIVVMFVTIPRGFPPNDWIFCFSFSHQRGHVCVCAIWNYKRFNTGQSVKGAQYFTWPDIPNVSKFALKYSNLAIYVWTGQHSSALLLMSPSLSCVIVATAAAVISLWIFGQRNLKSMCSFRISCIQHINISNWLYSLVLFYFVSSWLCRTSEAHTQAHIHRSVVLSFHHMVFE